MAGKTGEEWGIRWENMLLVDESIFDVVHFSTFCVYIHNTVYIYIYTHTIYIAYAATILIPLQYYW